MPKTILTDVAEAKVALAAGSSGPLVAISQVAIGDGNGVAYDPDFAQAALRNELARVDIQSRHLAGDGNNSWRIRAVFGLDTPSMAVREIGFFDADGDLISLWAGNDVDPQTLGPTEYVIDHVLTYSRVQDGLIVVNAPDDAVFDLAVVTARSLADLSLTQLKLVDAHRATHGPL